MNPRFSASPVTSIYSDGVSEPIAYYTSPPRNEDFRALYSQNYNPVVEKIQQTAPAFSTQPASYNSQYENLTPLINDTIRGMTNGKLVPTGPPVNYFTPNPNSMGQNQEIQLFAIVPVKISSQNQP